MPGKEVVVEVLFAKGVDCLECGAELRMTLRECRSSKLAERERQPTARERSPADSKIAPPRLFKRRGGAIQRDYALV